MKIGCVILAGGKSSRMGTDKALLDYDGKHFIEQIANELSWFEERIIARGGNQGFEEESLHRWKVIPDIYQDHGPIGGLHAALSACESDALFVVSCDMPLIKSDLARKLCENIEEAGHGGEAEEGYDAVISVENDGKIHPLCGAYRKSVVPVLEEQIVSDRNRVMEALQKLRVNYVTIDSPEQARQMANMNTPKDYESLLKPWNQ